MATKEKMTNKSESLYDICLQLFHTVNNYILLLYVNNFSNVIQVQTKLRKPSMNRNVCYSLGYSHSYEKTLPAQGLLERG